jgi:YD repeat-containing protein
MGLKGNPRSIRETQYKMNDVNPGLNEILLTVFTFDKDCRKVSEVTTDLAGEPKSEHSISYDKAGNILSEKKENTDVKGLFNVKYKYDGAGKLLRKEVLSGRKVMATYIYAYDERGNLSVLDIQKKSQLLDIFDEKFEYQHDSDNRLTEEVHRDGKDYKKTVFAYNEKNQLSGKVEYNQKGYVTYKYEYEYDDYGNVSIETADFRGDRINSYSFIYEYDEHGNWINKRSLADNKTYSLQIRIFSYD